uniref:Uncharacterized protein n=1 Tax=Oryzias melastigma TaxID=30732 RepID=A0A3B3CZ22_ORYME
MKGQIYFLLRKQRKKAVKGLTSLGSREIKSFSGPVQLFNSYFNVVWGSFETCFCENGKQSLKELHKRTAAFPPSEVSSI